MKTENDMNHIIDEAKKSQLDKSTCYTPPITMNDVVNRFGQGMCGRTAKMCMKSLENERLETQKQCITRLLEKQPNFLHQSKLPNRTYGGFRCHMGLRTGVKSDVSETKNRSAPKI